MTQFASPERLEKHHVRDVYDKIAPYFVGSRHKAWPRVEEFLLSLPAGSLIADVGCGTGKYLGLAPESFVVGSDSCVEFGEIAAKNGHNVVACENQNLPFRDNSFDAVISVGVIHHFASIKRREKALEELYRILQPGGKMLVYVWAFEQDERKFDGQDVLVPYKHYQRNKVLARRSQSIPARPRLQTHAQSKATPNVSAAASWRSRRAYSCDDSRRSQSQRPTQSPGRKGLRKQDPTIGMVHIADTSRYTTLQRIRNHESDSSLRKEQILDCSKRHEETPVKKLTKFLNSVIKKIFDDDESEKEIRSDAHAEAQINDVSVDTNTDFRAKVSALMSYFSAENREKYFKAEFISMLARKLLPGKDEFHLQEFSQTSPDCEESCEVLKPKVEVEGASGDVIICMNEEGANEHVHFGPSSERKNRVSLSVMARLVESLASSSDVESDSSSSSDYLTSDSSAAEDWDRVGSSSVNHGNKTFRHTTVNCQELAEPVCAADSQYSSSSSLFSTSSSSSSSSPSPSACSSSSSSLNTTTLNKRTKSELFQRYYHVFRAGELAKLVQDGIPSAVLLKEYYDHGNWAVILEKKLEEVK